MGNTLCIGTPEIAIRLRRHGRARRLVLRVGSAAEGPVLTMPLRTSLAEARTFALDHEAWLRRHLAARPERVPVAEGVTLPVAGEPTRVEAGAVRYRHDPGLLVVPGPAARVPAQAAAFLREMARRTCIEAVQRHAASLGLRHRRITLRDPRGRWGSCNAAGDLMFSWRLAMAPPQVLDYVAAHEVAHLAEMNHSRRFWALVERLMPGYAEPRAWLRREGAGLHRYVFEAP